MLEPATLASSQAGTLRAGSGGVEIVQVHMREAGLLEKWSDMFKPDFIQQVTSLVKGGHAISSLSKKNEKF